MQDRKSRLISRKIGWEIPYQCLPTQRKSAWKIIQYVCFHSVLLFILHLLLTHWIMQVEALFSSLIFFWLFLLFTATVVIHTLIFFYLWYNYRFISIFFMTITISVTINIIIGSISIPNDHNYQSCYCPVISIMTWKIAKFSNVLVKWQKIVFKSFWPLSTRFVYDLKSRISK